MVKFDALGGGCKTYGCQSPKKGCYATLNKAILRLGDGLYDANSEPRFRRY